MMTVIGPLLVLALVIALRLRKGTLEKPFTRPWLAPIAYAAVASLMLWLHPPSLLGWGLFAIGLAIGLGVGNLRARMFELRVDPASGRMLKRRTPGAILLLGGIVALRFLAAAVLAPPALLLLTDLMLGLILGLLVATKAVLRRRARRLRREMVEPNGKAT